MRVRAGWAVAAVLCAALGTAGCTDEADGAVLDAPTYAPMSLPGGFGEHPLTYVERDDGYLLSARAHDTTYVVEVKTRTDGDVALDPARLATWQRRTAVQPDGQARWRDQVGTVTISAEGPPGHTRRGVEWIAGRMSVVPKAALDELVAASRDNKRVDLQLEPLEFPRANVLIPHGTYGRLGRASFNVKTGKVRTGQSACMGCERPQNLWSWREGRVLHALVFVPRGTVVTHDDGVKLERRYDPMNSSDAILLSTERTDHPHFIIDFPHQPVREWAMQESIL